MVRASLHIAAARKGAGCDELRTGLALAKRPVSRFSHNRSDRCVFTSKPSPPLGSVPTIFESHGTSGLAVFARLDPILRLQEENRHALDTMEPVGPLLQDAAKTVRQLEGDGFIRRRIPRDDFAAMHGWDDRDRRACGKREHSSRPLQVPLARLLRKVQSRAALGANRVRAY